MNLLCSQAYSKRFPQGGGRVARAVSALLCLLLFSAVPAFADPVRIHQVVQTLSSPTGAPDLKLSSLVSQQDPATSKSSTQTGTNKDGSGTPVPKSDSVISGVTVTGQGQQLGVEIIQEAEVEGTICDCGEIYYYAGGGIPKWPFLFLAAVPLVFIDRDDDNETPTPTPTPTPPSTPTPTPPPPAVPEPASLLLLGTGLAAFGAGLRRRYSKTKTVEQTDEEE